MRHPETLFLWFSSRRGKELSGKHLAFMLQQSTYWNTCFDLLCLGSWYWIDSSTRLLAHGRQRTHTHPQLSYARSLTQSTNSPAHIHNTSNKHQEYIFVHPDRHTLLHTILCTSFTNDLGERSVMRTDFLEVSVNAFRFWTSPCWAQVHWHTEEETREQEREGENSTVQQRRE